MNTKNFFLLFVTFSAANLAGCAPVQSETSSSVPRLTQTASPVAAYTTSGAPVRLEFIGHDCFLLTAGDGTRIVMDPYRTSYVPVQISKFPENLTADVVTVNHLHPDHAGTSYVGGTPRVIYTPGPDQAGAVKITGYKSDQGYFDASPQGGSTVLVTVFVFEVGGVKIVHMGAAGVIVDQEILAAIEHADVVMIDAMGTESHPIPEMMAQLRKHGVRTIIPAHNSFKENERFFNALTVEEFIHQLSSDEVVNRADGSEITVTPGMPVQVLILTPSALLAQ
jgi:L-ascorbate metabolism protein UlaG (beta-lactamase superfamily)